jgi:XTP/dITP diphosphohydrolase
VLTVLLTSPRVAPGLLTWQAWSALRSGARVLASPAGHPQLPALAAAGVIADVVDPADGVLAEVLSAAVAACDGPVVWLAPPGDSVAAALVSGMTVPVQVLDGSHDLPGAHLLDAVGVMDTLRVSCPWDARQTHESLMPYLLEEAYEAADTMETGDLAALREELGDVLLQVLFHARVAAERAAAEGGFTIDDVADTLAAKLIRRHPHVFGSVSVSSAEDVSANWEEIKKAERSAHSAAAGAGVSSVLDGVPFGQPALSLAAQLQRRAERAGFAASLDGPVNDGRPVTGEDSDAEGLDVGASAEQEFGDELMLMVARARNAGIDPEMQLRRAAGRYADRVRDWERSRPAST